MEKQGKYLYLAKNIILLTLSNFATIDIAIRAVVERVRP